VVKDQWRVWKEINWFCHISRFSKPTKEDRPMEYEDIVGFISGDNLGIELDCFLSEGLFLGRWGKKRKVKRS
jgi:hypothetical protein